MSTPSQTNNLDILLVNSEPDARAALRAILEQAGFTKIVEADSGLTAGKILSATAIKMVITGVEIGDLDGWRLVRMIRAGIYRCDGEIPVIVMTKAPCERIAEVTAREFGINEVLALADQDRLPNIILSCLQEPGDLNRMPRMLVVEDNGDTSHLAKRILRESFDIEVATDGVSGLAAWKERRHELVLLDVMLPGMSGPEILKRIRGICDKQPVVIMTAYTTVELAEGLMLEGAVDFIPKPFRAEQLRRACELAIRRDDFLVSNAQFADTLKSLENSTDAFRRVFNDHQRLLNNLGTVVFELDAEGRLRFLSKAWLPLTDFSIEESVGNKLLSYIAPEGEGGRSTYLSQIEALLSGHLDQCKFEVRLLGRGEQPVWAECKLDAKRSKSGALTIFGCLEDISERKEAQHDRDFLAMHDSLTGLNNRSFFDNALRRTAAESGTHALLYVDLDHFKIVNDTLGHSQGDTVLRDLSALIRSRLRKSDLLCRIGGDEFAVLLPETDLHQAQSIAEEIRTLIQGFNLLHNEKPFAISGSIGICEINGGASSPDDYMKQADIALYTAKNRGRNMAHLYNPGDKECEELRGRADWVRNFREALAEDRLCLHFQPVLHIKSGEIAHYEALIRINLPDGGTLPPGAFIPALEAAGEMAMLDHWVISRAIAMLAEFPALRRVAINLSAQAFNDERLVALIEEKLKEEEVDPQQIIFELTESASMADIDATERMIASLHKLGCSFALDDFGTGYSSFNYLKQFPAECVKLDGSFISKLDQSPKDRAVVKAMAEVAGALGKETVAEFVESEAILSILREIGIDYAQGYHIGRPGPIESLPPSDRLWRGASSCAGNL